MSTCPRCQQNVSSQAITCPYCYNQLKAYGHPGIPLHQAQGDSFLCDTCAYHQDDSCNFPKRPHAKTCTLYQDITQLPAQSETKIQQSSSWLKYLQFWRS